MTFNPVPALAPLSARFVARLIDALLFVPLLAAASVFSVVAFGAALASLPAGQQALEGSRRLTELLGSTATSAAAGTLALIAWGLTVLLVLYQWFLLSTRGLTFGKRLCAIRIVGLDGEPAGFFRALFLRQWVFNLLFTFAAGLL
ncbi:MAG: RDD family protein, partial [Myxococcaceae bacterium]